MAESHSQRVVLTATLTGQFATSFPVTLFSVVLAPDRPQLRGPRLAS